jgi:hypothetical protein
MTDSEAATEIANGTDVESARPSGVAGPSATTDAPGHGFLGGQGGHVEGLPKWDILPPSRVLRRGRR